MVSTAGSVNIKNDVRKYGITKMATIAYGNCSHLMGRVKESEVGDQVRWSIAFVHSKSIRALHPLTCSRRSSQPLPPPLRV
jgi:hypothetical protein